LEVWYLTFTFRNLSTISTDITNEQFVYSCKCQQFQRSCPTQNAAAVSLLIRRVRKVRRE